MPVTHYRCIYCNIPFEPKVDNQLYCTPRHRKEWHNKRVKKLTSPESPQGFVEGFFMNNVTIGFTEEVIELLQDRINEVIYSLEEAEKGKED